ncbi:3884_t:CDS:2 [Acaulospora colombiana]|uniref:3884_t:CDS:1 n=1 Tax=Acaulospora colombiana TaxID=27376 RepID=A0ACA9JXF4_9GLOM|nr:3884_t:CDS:2 [Acaulospora colombiana]
MHIIDSEKLKLSSSLSKMGIPGFFRWLSSRYPHIVKEAKKTPRSRTDFLYLDINAFFHIALRKRVKSKQKKLTSRGMLSKVFAEMDSALNVCNPQMLVYIAMDGVAPRAKMNEQRSRRFLSRSEIDAENAELIEEAQKKSKTGFYVPVDSVSISAGTEFMQVAHDAIKYYIYQRLNGKFKNLQIIFSDSNVAGEGEHKVFRFMNAQRNHPDYNSKHRHVVCGGDADFLMYALLTHEPNLRILRPGLDGKDVMLNISTLRKLIIRDMVQQTSMEINEDNIIDDFVCIANLLGNDFLPRLSHLGEARVDMLFLAYNSYFRKERSYITKNRAEINIENFLKFIRCLSQLKKSNILRRNKIQDDTFEENAISKRANDYLKTICWSFQYYSGDCPSWRHFYPHHRSPAILEILKHVKADGFDQTFNTDTPMRPFDQLICILPPNSSYLVPPPFRSLFTDPDSPLQEYFPKAFKTFHYKALLPFVDEENLARAMEPGYALLDEKDALRNSINGRINMYAGRESSLYPTLHSLCSSGGRTLSSNSSVVFGKLSYDGPMLKSVNAPVDEFQRINYNKVAIAQYQLPLNTDESDIPYIIPQKSPNKKSFALKLQEKLPSDYRISHSEGSMSSPVPYANLKKNKLRNSSNVNRISASIHTSASFGATKIHSGKSMPSFGKQEYRFYGPSSSNSRIR